MLNIFKREISYLRSEVEYDCEYFNIIRTKCGRRLFLSGKIFIEIPERMSVRLTKDGTHVWLQYTGIKGKYETSFTDFNKIPKKIPSLMLWVMKEDLLIDSKRPIRLLFKEREHHGMKLPVLVKVTRESSAKNILRYYDFSKGTYVRVKNIRDKNDLTGTICGIRDKLLVQYDALRERIWQPDRLVDWYLPIRGMVPQQIFDFDGYLENNKHRLVSQLTKDIANKNITKLMGDFN